MYSREDYARRRVRELQHEGFNRAQMITHDDYTVACSYCWILWDHEGQPQHYDGCPNKRYLCAECNGQVSPGVTHCGACVLELL